MVETMFNYPFIVGFTGAAGSGKDTLYKFIAEELKDLTTRKLNFADPIKRMICNAFSILPDEFEYDKRNNNPLIPDLETTVPRNLLITLGTEWGRKMISEDLWVKLYERSLKTFYTDIVFTTDVRFENEYDFIKGLNQNNIIVKVIRDNVEKIDHESEKNSLQYDIIVYNNNFNNNNLKEESKKIASEIRESLFETK